MDLVPKYFGSVDFDVYHIIVHNEAWFCARDVGQTLGYKNATKACRDSVKSRYRKALCEIVDTSGMPPNKRNAVFINEPGLWSWLATSNKEAAEPFQIWLFETALPQLRMSILSQGRFAGNKTESSLHYKVTDFIRKFCPDALLTPGLGENQDSEAKRIDSWRKGYVRGTADILIHNLNARYNGVFWSSNRQRQGDCYQKLKSNKCENINSIISSHWCPTTTTQL